MTEKLMDWNAYITAMTALNGLTLEGERRDEVARQLERIAVMAGQLTGFPLDVEVEPGPVFRP